MKNIKHFSFFSLRREPGSQHAPDFRKTTSLVQTAVSLPQFSSKNPSFVQPSAASCAVRGKRDEHVSWSWNSLRFFSCPGQFLIHLSSFLLALIMNFVATHLIGEPPGDPASLATE
jgi:hypothetical protein